MDTALQFGCIVARRHESRLRQRQRLLASVHRRARGIVRRCEPFATRSQRFDFRLAYEQTGIGRVGCVKSHGTTAKAMAFPIHERIAGWQRLARFLARHAIHCIDPAEPVLYRAGEALVAHQDLVRQGRMTRERGDACRRAERLTERRTARRTARIKARFGGWLVRREAGEAVQRAEFVGLQTFAQYRLDRGLPPGFNAQLFPEARQSLHAMPVQPFEQLAVLGHRCLDLLQRRKLRLGGAVVAQ